MSALVNLCWAMLSDMVKHRGGRGRRAPNKHESFSVSLPPHLKALLDSWVTPELSRSEVVARLVKAHAQAAASGVEQSEAESDPTSTPQKKSEAPSRPSGEPAQRAARASMRAGGVKRTATERLATQAPVLTVLQKTVPRGLGWKPERYDQVNELLAHGDVLQADGVNYRTAKGELMGYKTAEALEALRVLAPI